MTQPIASPEELESIQTDGGAHIGGAVTAGHDVIGRDQISVTIQQTLYAVQASELPPSNLHLLNFARPLTGLQRNQIEQALGYRIGKTIHIQSEFENLHDFGPQAVALLDRAGLTPHEWQTLPILVNPPGFAPGAVCLLSEMHGRMGHFPAVVRMRPEPHRNPPVFVVAEIVALQALRDAARRRSQS
jgi:hypothetical protein